MRNLILGCYGMSVNIYVFWNTFEMIARIPLLLGEFHNSWQHITKKN